MPQKLNVEMVGGFADGDRFQVTDPPPRTLVMAQPPDWSELHLKGEMFLQPGDGHCLYDLAGVRDDGTRWYRYAGLRFPVSR